IVAIAGKLIVHKRWSIQQLCAALGDALAGEIAPRVVAVVVAPVFRLSIHGCSSAVGPRVLGRGETVQQVISKTLVAGAVTVVVNVPDIPVIAARCAIAYVEVISDGDHRLAGGVGRHVDGLKA